MHNLSLLFGFKVNLQRIYSRQPEGGIAIFEMKFLSIRV